jgi:hypothetical protein
MALSGLSLLAGIRLIIVLARHPWSGISPAIGP